MKDDSIRRAFTPATTLLVRVTRDGFLLDGHTVPQLAGRVARITLLRKLFENRRLLCHSPDGLRARDGTSCDHCRHSRCRPHLRLHLAHDSTRYILDLPATSANNLFTLEDEIRALGQRLDLCTLRLTVRNRGDWGEVTFECAHPDHGLPQSPSESPDQSGLPTPRVNSSTLNEPDNLTLPERDP